MVWCSVVWCGVVWWSGVTCRASNLHAVEGSDDVHGGLVVVVRLRAGGRRRLLRQLDERARHALQLPHVLPALADDAPDLRRRHHDLHRQPDVVRAGHEALLAHLLENQILCLKHDNALILEPRCYFTIIARNPLT